jgi:hypothetical protein
MVRIRLERPEGIPHTYHPMIASLVGDTGQAMRLADQVMQYATPRKRARVGVTSYPERRAPKYSASYHCMVVFAYAKGTTRTAAQNRTLADQLRRLVNLSFRSQLEEECDGIEGRPMPGPTFFVYVVLPKRDCAYEPYITQVVEEFHRRQRAARSLARDSALNPWRAKENVAWYGDDLDPWP